MRIERLDISKGTLGAIQVSRIQADIQCERKKRRSRLVGALDGYTDRTDLSALLTSKGRENA